LAIGRSGAEWPALTLFQVGADEGAVHSLLDDRLAGKRFRLRLEVERSRAAAEQPARRGTLVAHVNDGCARGSPGRQQSGDTLLGLWVVALSPGRILEGALYVDHEQGRKRHPSQDTRRVTQTRSWPGIVVPPIETGDGS